MAVDTRLKRQSATCILEPFMLSSVFPDTSGIVQAERQAIAKCYSGIVAVPIDLDREILFDEYGNIYYKTGKFLIEV